MDTISGMHPVPQIKLFYCPYTMTDLFRDFEEDSVRFGLILSGRDLRLQLFGVGGIDLIGLSVGALLLSSTKINS